MTAAGTDRVPEDDCCNDHASYEVITTEAAELKESLKVSKRQGLALDIDETLSATNVKWFDRCIEQFGNPEGLSVDKLIDKYHLAQNNPAWQSKEAQEWMHGQRTAPEAQDDLPVIFGAVEGVKELQQVTNVVAYLTVRPESVSENTKRWLREKGFPDLPVVAKPKEVPFELGNQWKAYTLHALWPEVTGIVDDNPKVPMYVGPNYKGTIYFFGHDTTTYPWAIPCKTWTKVVETVRNKESAKGNGNEGTNERNNRS